MKTPSMVRLSITVFSLALAGATHALAADAPPPAKPSATTVKPAALPAKPDARSASGPVKSAAAGSQQNRMKECNKDAKGKKGDERRAFMKSCLSTRKG